MSDGTPAGRILAVTGTGTEIGKTVLSAAIILGLRARGLQVDAVKPAATDVVPGDAGEDATLLARATDLDPARCVLATFREPRSPLAAARLETRALDVVGITATLRERARGCDVLVVEGVGGLLVPLAEDGRGGFVTVRDLLRDLDAEVVIAADAGLGTVNHSVLTVESARHAGLRVRGLALVDSRGTDPEFVLENATQIEQQADVPLLGILAHLDDPADLDQISAAAAALDIDVLATAPKDATAAITAADHRHVWHPFTQTSEWLEEQPPLAIRSGRGCTLVAEDGRTYIDGISSLWATVHGHAHPALDRALHEQAGRIAHSTFLGQTHEQGAMLAQELCARLPEGLTRVFYSEAGAAAVEVALRTALLAQHHRGQPRRTRFIALDEAYHGDTAGAVSVGRSEPFHRHLDPLLFDAIRIPTPYLGEEESLAALDGVLERHGDEVAALIVEPRVQGAAGMLTHGDGWLRDAVARARRAGALVITDEVATGFGRTGDLFATGGAGVRPDILTLGKGLTGGYLPLSATVTTEEIFQLFTAPYGEHRTLYYGHTYTGNPLACAVARASLRVFDDEATLEHARRLAGTLERLLAPLAEHPAVHEIRRRGVMTGIELRDGGTPFDPALRIGRRVTRAARRHGVVVRPLGDVVVLNPPLVMSDTEAEELVAGVAAALAEAVAARIAG